jgi:hypothetical protein
MLGEADLIRSRSFLFPHLEPRRRNGFLSASSFAPSFPFSRATTNDESRIHIKSFSMNSISSPASAATTQLPTPRFPPELFLEIFSHADRPTLSTLCSSSLAFLELATLFLYETARLNDLPRLSTLRTPRIAELLPSLAVLSVRILHITPSDNGPRLPTVDIPMLAHLYIHHCCPAYSRYTLFSSCADFLSSLDPPLPERSSFLLSTKLPKPSSNGLPFLPLILSTTAAANRTSSDFPTRPSLLPPNPHPLRDDQISSPIRTPLRRSSPMAHQPNQIHRVRIWPNRRLLRPRPKCRL